VVRNDGLGDFILTLPLIASLKHQWPHSRIHALLAAPLLPLLPCLPDLEGALADQGVLLKRHRGRFPPDERRRLRRDLLEKLRAERFDMALLPYAEGDSARLVHQAGIPVRVGPLRRLFCWRFTRHFRHTRQGSRNPEYALNLRYLPLLGLSAAFRFPRFIPPPGPEAASAPYAVLHPHKRSGTALAWPLERFVALACRLEEGGLRLIVVGDGADRPVLEEHFGALPGVRLETGRSLPELAGLIAGARLFVGNSSGPLHLAGLTRVPHIGFYPQDRVSAPERWRTLPFARAPDDFRDYLLASRFDKGCVVCEGERCEFFNCVASLPPEAVLRAMEAWGLPPPGAPAGKGTSPPAG
jgi:ADP-heptose:LPS heptosyltransferase